MLTECKTFTEEVHKKSRSIDRLMGLNRVFKHFYIQPEIVGDMTFVKASYKSVYGLIVSEWEKKKDKIIFKMEVPANTTATIVLPVEKLFTKPRF